MRLIDADVIIKKYKEKIERTEKRIERLEKEKESSTYDWSTRLRQLQDRAGEYHFVVEVLDEAPTIDLTATEIDKPIMLKVLLKVKEQCINGEGCDKCWYHQFCTLLPEEWEI